MLNINMNLFVKRISVNNVWLYTEGWLQWIWDILRVVLVVDQTDCVRRFLNTYLPTCFDVYAALDDSRYLFLVWLYWDRSVFQCRRKISFISSLFISLISSVFIPSLSRESESFCDNHSFSYLHFLGFKISFSLFVYCPCSTQYSSAHYT